MTRPAHDIAAGTVVTASLDGAVVLCLKVERIARDYINHYLVPLDPVTDRRRLALVYIDPDHALVAVEGARVVVEDDPDGSPFPETGDAFAGPTGPVIKLLDDPRAQKLHAYVDLTSGQVRPRLERRGGRLLSWRVER